MGDRDRLERLIGIAGMLNHLNLLEPIDDRSLIDTHVARVEVHKEQLIVLLAGVTESSREQPKNDGTLRISWQKTASKRRRELLLPQCTRPETARPIRAETRATLVASIARGRRWLDELITDPTASTECIATRERCSVRKVNMIISLAFLAPDLVQAAIEGRLPHGMGTARLCDLPAEWSRQYQILGLPTQ
jgi:hypothetical protein